MKTNHAYINDKSIYYLSWMAALVFLSVGFRLLEKLLGILLLRLYQFLIQNSQIL